VGWALGFPGLGFGGYGRRFDPEKVKFAAVQQLPLYLLAWLQADGGGQGQRKAHIEPGILGSRPWRIG